MGTSGSWATPPKPGQSTMASAHKGSSHREAGAADPRSSHKASGVPFSLGPEGLVSPASSGQASRPLWFKEWCHSVVWSSEEAGPQGEASCVDDGLEVVVGGHQLGRGALAVLGLYWEGLSENHCQRLWGTRQGCGGEEGG